MTQRSLIVIFVLAALAAITAADSFFVVQQGRQAIVLSFGQWKRSIADPGLHAKIPFVEDVLVFESRVLDIEPPGQQVTLGDKTRLEVDTYARYRITDPRRFYQALQNETSARVRLSNIVNSTLSEILARYTLSDLLSKKRNEVLVALRDRVRSQAEDTGVDIVDVRIRRADLPDQTSAPIFARMISERQREAAQARAEGQEAAARIKSEAERDRTQILSEAQKDAEVTRGSGDREALQIVSKATGKDPEFYAFYRSLAAYRQSFAADEKGNADSTLILSPDSRFFSYFRAPLGGK